MIGDFPDHASSFLYDVSFFRGNQTCTELRSTISRHVLPPISRWRKTVNSYRSSCRNSRASHRKGGFSGTGKGPIPLREKGGRTRRETVTTIWCMFDSPWILKFQNVRGYLALQACHPNKAKHDNTSAIQILHQTSGWVVVVTVGAGAELRMTSCRQLPLPRIYDC